MLKKFALAVLFAAAVTSTSQARTHHHHHSTAATTNTEQNITQPDNGIAKNSTNDSDQDNSVGLAIGLVVVLIIGGCFLYFAAKGQASEAESVRKRARLASEGRQAYENYLGEQKGEYPYISHPNDGKVMMMNSTGTALRFLLMETDQGLLDIRGDVSMLVKDIVSVELIKHERIITESTTSTRKSGALGRAVVGELVGGSTGALVGAISAGSKSNTVAVQRAVYQYSELVFGMTDLAKPVFRFESADHAELDQWLHRIRSAIAQFKNTLLSPSASATLPNNTAVLPSE